jgi:hypothetical protein
VRPGSSDACIVAEALARLAPCSRQKRSSARVAGRSRLWAQAGVRSRPSGARSGRVLRRRSGGAPSAGRTIEAVVRQGAAFRARSGSAVPWRLDMRPEPSGCSVSRSISGANHAIGGAGPTGLFAGRADGAARSVLEIIHVREVPATETVDSRIRLAAQTTLKVRLGGPDEKRDPFRAHRSRRVPRQGPWSWQASPPGLSCVGAPLRCLLGLPLSLGDLALVPRQRLPARREPLSDALKIESASSQALRNKLSCTLSSSPSLPKKLERIARLPAFRTRHGRKTLRRKPLEGRCCVPL